MCGIIGSINNENSFEIIINGLSKIKNRGLDYFGYCDGNKIIHEKTHEELKKNITCSKNIIAHNLHSIVNFVPQPIEFNNNIIVTNSEI